MEIETKGLVRIIPLTNHPPAPTSSTLTLRPQIKSTEDLLQLTRLIRELWVTGPLRKPNEGEQEAEAIIGSEVGEVVTLLTQLREQSRKRLISESGGNGRYVAAGGEKKSEGAARTVSGPLQTGRQ